VPEEAGENRDTCLLLLRPVDWLSSVNRLKSVSDLIGVDGPRGEP